MNTATPAADLVLRGGDILTFADWMPGAAVEPVRALAVRDGLVAAVGPDAEALIGPGTEVVELAGRTVVPGLNDTHLHLVCYAMARFGLRDASPAAIGDWAGLSAVLTAEAVGADGWIRAQGWDAEQLGRPGTAADIDAALAANGIPGTPTVLFDRTGHQLLAGTAALRALGITAATADPPGGVIVRDAAGDPTGVFSDAATALVLGAMPPVPADALVDVLRQAQRELNALGFTSVTDPGIGTGSATLFDGSASPLALDAIRMLERAGDLTLRTTVLLTFAGTGGESVDSVRAGLAGPLPHALDGCDPHWARIAGVKVFADGIQRSGTAWHHEPYGPEHRTGQLAVAGGSDAERVTTLHGILKEIGDAGMQTGVHATGDASADAVVAGLQALDPAARAALPYLIHGDFLPADGMPGLTAATIGWTANPVISRLVCGIGHELLGAERQAVRQPLGSALRAGVTVTLSSDAPVVDPDWRQAIIVAVERSQTDGIPHPDSPEAVSTTDALAMMTVTAGELDGSAARKGRLAPGFAADLVVLGGRWPDAAHVRDLEHLRTDLTVVGGRIVHRR
ncbi:amidohydrolase [Microbacterium mangrovi]|nr:amidohydrolase family protein [Microbacterium mangrovi]